MNNNLLLLVLTSMLWWRYSIFESFIPNQDQFVLENTILHHNAFVPLPVNRE
jgi:hypothetical protein